MSPPLVAPMSPPLVTWMSPEPLKITSEITSTLIKPREVCAADKNTEVRTNQVKRVAEEERQAPVASSDNPSLLNSRSYRGVGLAEDRGLFRETWLLAGDPLNHDGGRRR